MVVLRLGCCRPVRLHAGVNQRSGQVGYGSVGVMLLECHMVLLRSGKLRPLGLGVDYLQRSVSSYRGSSGDAIYVRCTSSACRLSSTCLRGSTTAWMLVGNRADEWIHFQREGCLNT